MSRPLHLDARRLVTGGAVAALANAGVVLLATRWLSPEDRGVMVVAATVPALVSLVASLGVGNAVKALRPGRAAGAGRRLSQAYTALSVGATALGAGVSAAVAAALAPLVSAALASPALLSAVALGGGTATAATLLADAWYSSGRFAAGARWAAGAAVTGLLLVVVLRPATGAGLLLAQLSATAAVHVLQVVALVRAGLVSGPVPHRTEVGELLRLGLPSLGQSVGTTVVLRSDRLLLALVAAPQVVAVYALASTVSEASRLVPTSLGQVALRRAAHSERDAVDHLDRLAWRLALGIGLIAIAGAAVLAGPLFGPDYGATPTLVAVMVVGEVFLSRYLVRSMALIGLGAARVAGRIGLVAAAASVPAYLLGGSLLGSVGCAVAGVVLYAGMSLTARDAEQRVGVAA